MLERNQLLSLMKTLAGANPSAPTAYSYNGESLSYAAMNETLRRELAEIAGTYELYRENKNLVFGLIEQTLNPIVPAKVLERYGDFAEVKTFAQGDRPVFTRKVGRLRAKQFITRVGLAGVYEVFKLGAELTKRGLGFPQYDNDDVVIPGLLKLGYSPEDAYNYVVAACWEFIIPKNGMEIPNIDALSLAAVNSQSIIYCLVEYDLELNSL